MSDGNKRTGLAVALEYLSLNDFELKLDNELFADAIRDVVIGDINESDLADLFYSQHIMELYDNRHEDM
jgi:death-on-curing protein